MDIDDAEEVEVMPGVYITDYRTGASTSQPTSQSLQPARSSNPPTNSQNTSNPPLHCDSDPHITHDINLLENSIKHLIRSNVELAKAMEEDPDPVFAEAIQENLNVIAKRKLQMNELLAKQGKR